MFSQQLLRRTRNVLFSNNKCLKTPSFFSWDFQLWEEESIRCSLTYGKAWSSPSRTWHPPWHREPHSVWQEEEEAPGDDNQKKAKHLEPGRFVSEWPKLVLKVLHEHSTELKLHRQETQCGGKDRGQWCEDFAETKCLSSEGSGVELHRVDPAGEYIIRQS